MWKMYAIKCSCARASGANGQPLATVVDKLSHDVCSLFEAMFEVIVTEYNYVEVYMNTTIYLMVVLTTTTTMRLAMIMIIA